MNVAILGTRGPVAHRLEIELSRRRHTLVPDVTAAQCIVVFPGPFESLPELPANRRIVLRSHAYAYGASPKNPGLLTEERVSLLAENSPERRWLRFEEEAAAHSNHAIIRLSNVADPDEGDTVVKKLSSKWATTVAGRDPNLQFISVHDAARALASACESPATGIFNASGEGAVPLKAAFRAAGTRRLPVPEIGFGSAVSADPDQLRYGWTVSGERARYELGFDPLTTSAEALAELLHAKSGARPSSLQQPHDDWGLDLNYIRAWSGWFNFLRNVYWRIDSEGMENIPAVGSGIFAANHRGFMPLDGVMHVYNVLAHRQRIVRFMINHILLRQPFMSNFLTKHGGVIATNDNARLLLERGQLVGMFPEGIRGTFQPYSQTLKLRDFSRSGLAQMAIENQAPVIPVAVLGHSEIFPILGRINSSWVTRELGWPYLPIAPMFPLAPIPLPSKWHVRVLPPVGLQGLTPRDAENPRITKDFSSYIHNMLQAQITDMASRRKHIFWGRLREGPMPSVMPFRPRARGAQLSHAATEAK